MPGSDDSLKSFIDQQVMKELSEAKAIPITEEQKQLAGELLVALESRLMPASSYTMLRQMVREIVREELLHALRETIPLDRFMAELEAAGRELFKDREAMEEHLEELKPEEPDLPEIVVPDLDDSGIVAYELRLRSRPYGMTTNTSK